MTCRAAGRLTLLLALAMVITHPPSLSAQTRANANCTPAEDVFYNPGNGQDIVLPSGFKVEVFAKDLNFPTAVAFEGNKEQFLVFVLESGTGLPGRCNDNTGPGVGGPAGKFSSTNPFTPDILVFNQNKTLVAGPIGKPTPTGGGFQPDGPAIGLAFEHGAEGGTLFATDSNQGVRGAPGASNNTSRIVTVDVATNKVTPFITGLPTGDHPTEQIRVKDGFVIWSQGSATNSGVTGHDNGGGGNQHEIPCQDIVLSNNLFDSGDGHLTSGFSNHGVQRPGATLPAFESATKAGMCTGAILRAQIQAKNPADTIEPIAWGFRNPFGIQVAPDDHPLQGCIFVTENGEDERGARPTNNAPDRLACAKQNADGTPQFHGWPDRFGFLDSTQAIFNPIKGPGDDLCSPPSPVFPACDPAFTAKTTPVRHVLAFPPQPPIAPLAIEPTDVATVGTDFVPKSFAGGVVRRDAALVSREGDFGFSPANGTPEEGHDVQLVNFSQKEKALELELSRFAFNCPAGPPSFQAHTADGSPVCLRDDTTQAFVSHLRGINRPVDLKFGPDDCAYLVDYGAVRDFGQSHAQAKFTNPADAPLVQIPHTGVIWKICKQ